MLEAWALVEADLQDAGIDVESGILAERSARWLKIRLIGLLSRDTRVARYFQAKQPKPPPPEEETPMPERHRRR